jgi:hypothetical protein
MVPPGDTIWGSLPGAASGRSHPGSPQPSSPQPGSPPSGSPQPGPYGSVPPAPVPRGYAPYGGQAQPGPGPSYPAQPAPAPVAKPQQSGSVLGAIALGLGAGAWGIWRLVTATGNSPKPPGGP